MYGYIERGLLIGDALLRTGGVDGDMNIDEYMWI